MCLEINSVDLQRQNFIVGKVQQYMYLWLINKKLY